MCNHVWVVTMLLKDNRCIAMCSNCKKKNYKAIGVSNEGKCIYG